MNMLEKRKDSRGWPWNKESRALPKLQPVGTDWPRITIVTPSYNQGEFIEETIRSILLQNYPNLEYIIMDGGSTDNTIEIIKKYEKWITYWVSEPDKGQSDAINKGFEKATGVYGNWINSDDLLAKDALFRLSEYLISADPDTLFIGQCILTNKNRTKERLSTSSIRTLDDLIDITNYWRNGSSIAQQNVFFNINSFRNSGGLNINNHFTMDFELWGDLLLQGNTIQYLDFPVGIFRKYDGQKISDKLKTTRSLVRSARKLVKKNKELSSLKKLNAWHNLYQYEFTYSYKHFRKWLKK